MTILSSLILVVADSPFVDDFHNAANSHDHSRRVSHPESLRNLCTVLLSHRSWCEAENQRVCLFGLDLESIFQEVMVSHISLLPAVMIHRYTRLLSYGLGEILHEEGSGYEEEGMERSYRCGHSFCT
jgi:hypothetical protein